MGREMKEWLGKEENLMNAGMKRRKWSFILMTTDECEKCVRGK